MVHVPPLSVPFTAGTVQISMKLNTYRFLYVFKNRVYIQVNLLIVPKVKQRPSNCAIGGSVAPQANI